MFSLQRSASAYREIKHSILGKLPASVFDRKARRSKVLNCNANALADCQRIGGDDGASHDNVARVKTFA